MVIGGFQKFTMVDYPGKLSAIIFTRGCNFRCPYCHNPELVDYHRFSKAIEVQEVLSFLKSRAGKLDAVSITGGEPTLHTDLPDLIRQIRAMGYLIKLDTNGTNPKMVRELVSEGLLDYIAMDIKAPLKSYEVVTRVSVDTKAIQESINFIRECGVDYEFRTTVVELMHSREDLLAIQKLLGNAKRYFIQNFVPIETLDAT
ncbi:MAG: anaerobic ribonucleoside-triphosphate reductase activating protein, partial [Candidatus Cloacimonetes bacterium]|nr:anaerobic ribonucleoside-triphosphate reductase activating protein [Candidatus Cloacimonadota bacterium]